MIEEIKLLKSKEEKDIENLVYEFRGKQVMLDNDIARLFGVETKKLNQQVKRNISRFPEDFCFKLLNREYKSILRSQNVTSNALSSKRRYNPYVFTEQGIIALAGVLKSEVADEMCVRISRVFVKMRTALVTYKEPIQFMSKLYGEFVDFKEFTVSKFDEAFNRIEKLEPKKQVLFLNEKHFDAYEAIITLIERAKESIVVVDPYADDKSLVFLSHRQEGVRLIIYRSKYSKLKQEEVDAFIKQYGEINIKEHNQTHNRYLILDKSEVYDLGISLNRLGKIFTMYKLEIKEVVEVLINLFS